jgi:hypothetical protein
MNCSATSTSIYDQLVVQLCIVAHTRLLVFTLALAEDSSRAINGVEVGTRPGTVGAWEQRVASVNMAKQTDRCDKMTRSTAPLLAAIQL